MVSGGYPPTVPESARLGGQPAETVTPEPPEAPAGVPDPVDQGVLHDEVGQALSVVTSRLSPAERTSFILHDVFGFPFRRRSRDGRAHPGGMPATGSPGTTFCCGPFSRRARRGLAWERQGSPPGRARSEMSCCSARARMSSTNASLPYDVGYTAPGTTDFQSDITDQFDVTKIDLVSLGGLVPPDREAELKERMSAINPKIIFIDSLAGIPGLIAGQVQEAFTADLQNPAQAPSYLPGSRSIRLTLADPTRVKATVWFHRRPPEPRSGPLLLAWQPVDPADSRRPNEGQGDRLVADLTRPTGPQERFARPPRRAAPTGEHAIPVPGHIPPQAATPSGRRLAPWFATVQTGPAIYNISIPTGQEAAG
jgi:hypothetical protein